jgi:hypothetical protein
LFGALRTPLALFKDPKHRIEEEGFDHDDKHREQDELREERQVEVDRDAPCSEQVCGG